MNRKVKYYQSTEDRLEQLCFENGIDPLNLHDAPEKIAYSLLPLVFGTADFEFCVNVIRNFGGNETNIETDKILGYRLFDPFYQIIENEYTNSNGWTHWTHGN